MRDDMQMAGVSDVFGAMVPTATAEAMAVALTPVVGGRPVVSHYGAYSTIQFTEPQEARLSDWVLMQLRKEPGSVRVSLGGVALKVIARQYWPWVLGVAGLGIAAGFAVSAGRRG